MIRDAEDLLEAVRTHVMAGLNARITFINTQKNDSLKIKTITADTKHYVLGATLQDLPNNEFVNFTITELPPKQARGNIAIEPTIMVEVVFDNPKTEWVMKASMRYMRAIYETLADFEDQNSEISGFQMEALKPMMVPMVGRELIISGVTFSCGIGT